MDAEDNLPWGDCHVPLTEAGGKRRGNQQKNTEIVAIERKGGCVTAPLTGLARAHCGSELIVRKNLRSAVMNAKVCKSVGKYIDR
ncbi:hypothetical protein E2C01_069342 [Portunus trituberculatus]|uniref:Uncharacterized protein n=1 Tax=Portunus trituberculatus TaxID=210409 RepID=A0A5B7HZ34_PORTR|nr:hypothetical protein [Portunus trituberculatus]